MATIHQRQLDNGLWLLAEPISGAQSLAMTMLVPAGVAAEPAGQHGLGAILAEHIVRGAGELDARQHSDALDRLGVQRSTSVNTHHLTLHAVMLGEKLSGALPLLMDMIVRPRLPESALEPCRDLAIQSIDALDDEPQQRVMLELRRRHLPEPFSRSPLGDRAMLERITLEQVRSHWRRTFVPGGSILGFAGRFDWQELQDRVEAATAGWQGAIEPPTEQDAASRGVGHQTSDTQQVHIGVAYDAPPEPDDDSVLQRAAVAVLSGGMSGRLFTEVREKRGLVYSVYASYSAGRERGAVLSYAGTTTPRAQETLDVLLRELSRMSEGIDAEEFGRAIIGMKSRLVMQGESTGARASAIAHDQYLIGRPRSLDELAGRVESVTLDRLNDFVRRRRAERFTVVTVGPEPLVVRGSEVETQGSAQPSTAS